MMLMRRPSPRPQPSPRRYNLLSLGGSKLSEAAKQRIIDSITKPPTIIDAASFHLDVSAPLHSPGNLPNASVWVSHDQAINRGGGGGMALFKDNRKTHRKEGAKTSAAFYNSSVPISIDKTPAGDH